MEESTSQFPTGDWETVIVTNVSATAGRMSPFWSSVVGGWTAENVAIPPHTTEKPLNSFQCPPLINFMNKMISMASLEKEVNSWPPHRPDILPPWEAAIDIHNSRWDDKKSLHCSKSFPSNSGGANRYYISYHCFCGIFSGGNQKNLW